MLFLLGLLLVSQGRPYFIKLCFAPEVKLRERKHVRPSENSRPLARRL